MTNQPALLTQAPPPVLGSPEEAYAAARAYADAVEPTAASRDRERSKPIEELRLLAESGLLGLRVPAAFGGPELARSVVVEVTRLIARADPTIAQTFVPHYIGVEVLGGDPSDERAQEVYGAILREGARLGSAFAERGTSTTAEIRTVAKRSSDGGWTVSGHKYYATGALGASWLGVIAIGPAGGPAIAFVPTDADGLTLDLDQWSSFGQRATFSGAVILDGVRLPDRYVIDTGAPPPVPPPSALGAFDQAIHAAIDSGIARAALEDGAQYVRTRTRPWIEAPPGSSAAEEPLLLRRFGELTTQLHALEALLERGARTVDEAFEAPALTDENTAAASLAVAEAKAYAQEVAVGIASGIFELTGAASTDERYGLDRHWRNVRTHSLHDPARWKYIHIGNHTVTGALPPRIPTL
ncbi:MAG TPA: acyl-CoA dehydrogenase family protein [Conexibacter sp.]|jgi:SfnB family sulfur acquisition oxidoreductase